VDEELFFFVVFYCAGGGSIRKSRTWRSASRVYVCPELASLLIYVILELLLHNLLDRFFPAIP
jgi:hypothetical protein